MKSFQTTRDVLQCVRHFHLQLAEYYQKLSERSAEERIKMLLEYMARHEQGIEALLSRYEENASHMILNSWFQFTENQAIAMPCEEFDFQCESSIDQVIESALQIDDCLIRFYRMLADCSRCDPVTDLFRNLLDWVEQEKHHKVRTMLSSMDI